MRRRVTRDADFHTPERGIRGVDTFPCRRRLRSQRQHVDQWSRKWWAKSREEAARNLRTLPPQQRRDPGLVEQTDIVHSKCAFFRLGRMRIRKAGTYSQKLITITTLRLMSIRWRRRRVKEWILGQGRSHDWVCCEVGGDRLSRLDSPSHSFDVAKNIRTNIGRRIWNGTGGESLADVVL